MKNMPWRKIPLGRMVTIFCFVMLGVAGVLIMTDSSRAQDKIEVQYSSDETHELPRAEGHAGVDPQTAAETQSELECEFASSTCKSTNQFNGAMAVLLQNTTGWYELGAETEQEGGTPTESLLNFLGKGIAMTFTPVASGVYYVADAASNIGLASPTYAQGFGYYGLSPFLTLWKVIRNFTYMIFAVVIIGVAISVLLRQSFSGKSALTIQQVLPNVIVALIAITFSYAIAGFLIDIMYWIMYAVGFFIQAQINPEASTTGVNEILGSSIFGVLWSMLTNGAKDAYNGVGDLVEGAFGDGGWDILGKIAGTFSGALAALIMIIVIIVSVFKLFLTLTKSYVYVIMYTVFSPIILIMQVFNPQTLKKWALSIAANLSPFVITFFMIVFLGVANALNDTGGKGWEPPFLFGQNSIAGLGAIIGLGMILAMNEIIAEMKKKIGGGGGFFEQMAGKAQENAEKAWKGTPGKFGRGAMGAGARLAWAGGKDLGALGGKAASGIANSSFGQGVSRRVRGAGNYIANSRIGQGTKKAGQYVANSMIGRAVGGTVKGAGNLAKGTWNVGKSAANWLDRATEYSALRKSATNIRVQYANKARQAASDSALRSLPGFSGISYDSHRKEAQAYVDAVQSPVQGRPGFYQPRGGFPEVTMADINSADDWLKGAGSNSDTWEQSGWQLFSSPRRRKNP